MIFPSDDHLCNLPRRDLLLHGLQLRLRLGQLCLVSSQLRLRLGVIALSDGESIPLWLHRLRDEVVPVPSSLTITRLLVFKASATKRA